MNLTLTIFVIAFFIIFSFLELYFEKSFWGAAIFLSILSIIWISSRDASIVPDTNVYLRVYDSLRMSSISEYSQFSEGFEFFYVFLNFIGILLKLDQTKFLGLIVAVNIIIIMWALIRLERQKSEEQSLKMKIYPCYFLSCYFSYFGLFYNAIAVRAGLAFSFVFLASTFFIAKKYKSTVIICIIAVLFHSSALISILGVLVANKISIRREGYKKWLLVIVFVWLGRVGYIFGEMINIFLAGILNKMPILNRYVGYLKNITGSGFYSQKNLLFLIIGVSFFVAMYKNRQMSYYIQKYMNICMIGLTLTFILNVYPNGYRMSETVTFFEFLLLYWIGSEKNRMTKFTKISIAIVLIVVSFGAALNVTGVY